MNKKTVKIGEFDVPLNTKGEPDFDLLAVELMHQAAKKTAQTWIYPALGSARA